MNALKIKWKRIELRKAEETDYKYFANFISSKKFLQFMVYEPVNSREEFKNFLTRLFDDHDSPHFFSGPFTFTFNDTPIGMTGIAFKPNQKVNYELWYFLNPQFSGKGLMIESLEGLFDYIKLFKAIDKVCAHSVEGNIKSTKILEKFNFELIQTFKNGFNKYNEKHDVHYFEKTL